MNRSVGVIALAALLPHSTPVAAQAPRVGPTRGTVIVVGGGSMGPEIYSAFIQAAGGPDALIVDVPTAGGARTYAQNAPGTRGWREAGARNVIVLHTTDRKLADSDSFAAILGRAGGVWFEGGRQYRLVDVYAGTKSERGFHEVLARGGVVGGSSAGATILGDFLVRGAPSNDNAIMDDPSHRKGFAFLRGVAIDQHVVARERLADLADSIMPKYPQLLGISEDEGTAWIVRGDTARIVGRGKAFVYGGRDTDARLPFLTLYPGDRYDLGARTVISRAADDSPVSVALVDSLLRRYEDPAAGGATVLVARGGVVLVDKAYGLADQPKYMPATTLPQFPLGGISAVFVSLCSQLPPAAVSSMQTATRTATDTTPLQRCIARRIAPAVGLHRTTADADGQVHSSVDELYRLALGLEQPRVFTRDTSAAVGATTSIDAVAGWLRESQAGNRFLAAYGTPDGRRAAFLREAAALATVIVLTNDDSLDAKAVATRLFECLLTGRQ